MNTMVLDADKTNPGVVHTTIIANRSGIKSYAQRSFQKMVNEGWTLITTAQGTYLTPPSKR